MIKKAFAETKDRSQIWDGHFAGREREAFIVQQLHDLAALPPSGFKVGFFLFAWRGAAPRPGALWLFLIDPAAIRWDSALGSNKAQEYLAIQQ